MAIPALNYRAANQILTAYNTENLRHSLAQYPKRIFAARQQVNQARKALKTAELERDALEAEMILLVSVETDERGKAKYTNVQMRDAELLRRKANTPEYMTAAEFVADAEMTWQAAQDTLQMLLDEYQSARIVARLIAGELGVISGLADTDDDDTHLFATQKEAF